jgi:hypothetical protein
MASGMNMKLSELPRYSADDDVQNADISSAHLGLPSLGPLLREFQNPGPTSEWTSAADTAAKQSPDHAEIKAEASSPGWNPHPDVALYEPGNEEACRKLLDRAVASDPRTFALGDPGGPLVILRVPEDEVLPSATRWEGDMPGTTLATPADIVERAQKLKWYRRGKSGGLVRIHAPRSFANDYLVQMRGRYGAPVLIGVSRVPAIEGNGAIRFLSGHELRSGLYYDRPVAFDVPESVPHESAREAAEQMLLPYSEYNLGDPNEGKALLLALTFTALRRSHLPSAPMFVVRSSMPGTGKGLLVRSVAQLAYGTAPTVLTWGGSAEEFEKRLASVMLQMPGRSEHRQRQRYDGCWRSS